MPAFVCPVAIASLLALVSGMACAQTVRTWRIADIRALTADEIQHAEPVLLRGVITHVASSTTFFLQDETEGIYVERTDKTPALSQGDFVELRGEIAPGLFAPIVKAALIQILGKSPLPPAQTVSYAGLATGQWDSQRVEVRGVVRRVMAPPHGGWSRIVLAMEGGRLEVEGDIKAGANPERWVDAQVCCQGIAVGRFNKQRQLIAPRLVLQSLDQLAVEKSAPPEPFALPARSVASLLQFSPRGVQGHRIRIEGVVLAQQSDGALFIRDSSGAIEVQTTENTPVAIGAGVEVAGFATMGTYRPLLEDALLRKTGTRAPPEPVETTVPHIFTGATDADLISVDAELVLVSREDGQTLLTLAAGGSVFRASLLVSAAAPAGQRASQLPVLQPGSRLRLRGICRLQGQRIEKGIPVVPRSFSLLLRSPADVAILQAASWWTKQRLLDALGIAGLLAAAASAWAWTLRRRVRQQTGIIRHKIQREGALEERARLAREFHDSLHQELAGVTLHLDNLKTALRLAPETAAEIADQTQAMLRIARARRAIASGTCARGATATPISRARCATGSGRGSLPAARRGWNCTPTAGRRA